MEQLILKGQIEGDIDVDKANEMLVELTQILNKYDVDYHFRVTEEIDTTGIDAITEVHRFHTDSIYDYFVNTHIRNKKENE